MKKRLIFALSLLLILQFSLPVQAAAQAPETALVTIAPRWINTHTITYGVALSNTGKCVPSVSITTYNSTDKIYVNVELQKLNGGTFEYYEDWNTSGTGNVLFSAVRYVPKGTYRIKVVANIYNSKGNFVERIPLYSSSKTY